MDNHNASTNTFVRDNYNQAADDYAAHRDQFKSLPWLERFGALLPAGGTVLDVGCGAGLPVDAWLVEHGFQVRGIDISPRMIELAKANVPRATYTVRDMSTLVPDEERVAGIVSFYAIFHTPREGHQALLDTLASYLTPGGAFLATMGAGAWEGYEDDFHGAPMYWSHYGAEVNRTMVQQAGFRVVVDEIDDSGGEQHQIILAKRS